MSSVVIDPPVLTPANEWAKDTADALQPAPSIHDNAKAIPMASTVSTPGFEVPGAYPRDAVQGMANDSPYKIQDTVGRGVEGAKQYIPAQETVNQHIQTAKTYIPVQESVQRALGTAAETAKQYFPESVVTAVQNMMPHGLASTNGTTPPVDVIDTTAKPAFDLQDSSASFFSNPQITDEGMSENMTSSSTPMSNTTVPAGGVGKALGNAVGGVATTLDPTGGAKFSKPAEPYISTSNIQEPYGESKPVVDEAEKRPHVVEQDSGIQKTNFALANLQAGPGAAKVAELQDSAPVPPPKPDNASELTGGQKAKGFAQINAQPTQEHVQNDTGLNAPSSVAANKVGGNENTTAVDHDRSGSLGSEASDESGSGKEDHFPKKGRGSRLVAKMKEKLHHHKSS